MTFHHSTIRFVAALIAAALLVACVVTAPSAANEIKGAHAKMGLACAACHGEEATPRRPAMSVCLGCHVGYDALAAKTARLQPNPHKSHLGDLRCTYCHSSHGASKIYCNECHDFKHLKLD